MIMNKKLLIRKENCYRFLLFEFPALLRKMFGTKKLLLEFLVYKNSIGIWDLFAFILGHIFISTYGDIMGIILAFSISSSVGIFGVIPGVYGPASITLQSPYSTFRVYAVCASIELCQTASESNAA